MEGSGVCCVLLCCPCVAKVSELGMSLGGWVLRVPVWLVQSV